jgi:hypothetical protein
MTKITINRCLACINSIYDCETGYTCKLKLWDCMNSKCSRYAPDFEYIEKTIREQIEHYN